MLECMYLTEESKADTKRLTGMHVGAGNDGAMMSETAFMPHGWESPARTRARATPCHEHTLSSELETPSFFPCVCILQLL